MANHSTQGFFPPEKKGLNMTFYLVNNKEIMALLQMTWALIDRTWNTDL